MNEITLKDKAELISFIYNDKVPNSAIVCSKDNAQAPYAVGQFRDGDLDFFDNHTPNAENKYKFPYTAWVNNTDFPEQSYYVVGMKEPFKVRDAAKHYASKVVVV